MKKDLYELSAEINGIAMVVLGLSNQLDSNMSSSLTPSALGEALFGVSSYLERISNDLTLKEGERPVGKA